MKKSKEIVKKTPRRLMPTGEKLSPEMQWHLEKGRAAMRENIKQAEKEKTLEKYIIEQRRKAS